MQPRPHVLVYLGVLCLLTSALGWGGCTSTDQQATVDDLNNKAFTFTSGVVFHPALANISTTLEFTNRATTFALTSPVPSTNQTATSSAMGTNQLGSCLLTVNASTYPAAAGPQVGQVITLQPCEFDETNRTLTVVHGALTAISQPAITRVVNATAVDLNNRTFLFSSGVVFEPTLANFATTLRFTNNATAFTLTTTSNNGSSTASGNHTLGATGGCILTVTTSNYPTTAPGVQVNSTVTLRPCQYNSSTGVLTLSNADGTTTISSL